MNIKEILADLQVAYNFLLRIDDSETFQAMLADPLFPVDHDDAAYLVYQLNSLICCVNK